MYFLLGISLILTFILIVNLGVAAAASLVWRAVESRVGALSPSTQARVIIGLRIMPVAFALVFVLAFVVPSYLLLEPNDSGETISLKLAVITLASSLAVLVAVSRVLRTWFVTNRLLKNWLADAEPLEIDGLRGRVYRIEHQFPVIGVIGVFCPRVFVANSVLGALDEPELAAAIDHENGHRAAYDNLKRGVLRVCRDLLILPIGSRLDRAWAETAETAADEYAAVRDKAAALDLASALVKIGKLVPHGVTPALPAGAYLVEDGDDISTRVTRLISISEHPHTAAPARLLSRATSSIGVLAMLVILLLPLIDRSVLRGTHTVVETLVAALQ
jgi:Zn-dependent protease with chaperone function